MKKIIVCLSMVFITSQLFSQIGIGTITPNALLDIKSTNQAAPSNTDGILIPKIDVFPTPVPTALQQGMLVYLTTTVGANPPGFYYWNFPTLTWIGIGGTAAGGTLDQAYDFGGAGLGKTITADAGAVTINGTDGLVSTGTLNNGAVAPSGTGIKMFWNPRKAAFRAGYTVGTQWDDANIGLYSVAFGQETIASGYNSTAFGVESTASGNYATAFGETTSASGTESTAFGFGTDASGETSTAFGAGTTASGNSSTAFGEITTASGRRATAFGYENTAPSFGETVLGIGATIYTPTANGDTQYGNTHLTDRLLVVGNATDINNNNFLDNADRHNALTILKNGNTGIGTDTPNLLLEIKSSNQAAPLNTDGILIPKVDVFPTPPPTALQQGMLVYLTTTVGVNLPGFYYWNNPTTSWLDITGNAGWKLTGNTLLDNTSFIGTNNDVDLILKRNGFRAGRIGINNTSYGLQALNPTTTGTGNAAVGNYALNSNTTGNGNTAFGIQALLSNTTGIFNTAVGQNVLSSNTTGNYNTAIGRLALDFNTTGDDNVAVGDYALSKNTTGNYNTATGLGALERNRTGSNNTATGRASLLNNSTGQYNTANGHDALNSNTTGSRNTALGHQSFYAGTAYFNSTALGYSTNITASNQVRIGSGVTSIGGPVGWTNISDKRFKDETQQQVPGLSFIKKLRPLTYYFNDDRYNAFIKMPDSLRSTTLDNPKHYLQSGFMAQEVEQAANELGYEFNGVDEPKNNDDFYGLRYAMFVVPLVKAVQELEVNLEDKTAEIQALKDKNAFLELKVDSQTNLVNKLLKRVEDLEKKN